MYRGQAGYADLLRTGLLREAGVVKSIVCDDCEDPHGAAVVFDDERYGYYCPELGFVALEREQIVGAEPDFGKVVDALASAFGCKRRNSKPVHGATWRVGVIETDQDGVAVYLNPRLRDGNDLHDLEAALRCEVVSPRCVVLTACGSLTAAGSKTVNLADAVDLDPATSALIAISDLPAIAGVRRVPTGGAPNLFEEKSFALLAMRERRGLSLKGRNEEAAALREVFSEHFPADSPPSTSSENRYVTKFRGGS